MTAKQEEVSPEIRNRAIDIMANGDPVKYILDNHQKLHVGDLNLAKSLLVSIGIQSVLNSDGLHPKVSGETGKGKSHACKAMTHLIPREYLIASSLSDKAVYYLSLKPGSIIFSDDVNLTENLEGVIKRATTNFQQGDTYTTIDKDRKPRTLIIPARISWWLTSVNDDQSIQLLNRTLGGGVDESQEQDERVSQFQLQQAVSGDLGFPENHDVEICREIIWQIKRQPFIVKIPFAEGMIWKDKSNRRNLPIFLDIIKAFTVLRFRQRPIIDGYLLAAIEDYEDAKALYCSRAENQTLKLTEIELKLCRSLHELTQHQGECDSKTLERALGLTQGRVHQLIHGRKERPDSGLLNKLKGLHVERRTVKTDDDETTTKNFYSIEDFNVLASYDSVVNLPEKVRTDYYRYYTTIVSTITDKTDNYSHPINTITLNMNIDSNNGNSKDSSLNSLSENQKMCNTGNSQTIDNDSDSNSVGKSVVIVAADNGNRLKLRMLKDIPKFVGSDGKHYEPHMGDILEIPSANAKALINRGAAVMEGAVE